MGQNSPLSQLDGLLSVTPMDRLRSRNAPARVAARRARQGAVSAVTPVVSPLARWLVRHVLRTGRFRWTRWLPLPPRPLGRRAAPPVWPPPSLETPDELRGVPGIRRNAAAEARAHRERPLHAFMLTHVEAAEHFLSHGWNYLLPALPRLLRGTARMLAVAERSGAVEAAPPPRAAAEVSRLVRTEAARLGLSAVGFTGYDPHYTFAQYEHAEGEDNVIVCVLEQDWAATQTAPSARAERAAFAAYNENLPKVTALAAFLQRLGYRATPQDQEAHTVLIRYGVEAGLGQLGLNGQLLTPQAGSRCRLALITTSAPLELGQPTDYGIEKLCDACQLCVRRCPSGAIPKARREHRGVVKAKIKPERCFPTMVRTHGCAVCMKVCPVQRYGLEAVQRHFVATGGQILGKGTDELEGYVWPLDGRFYGPGQKPRMSREVLNPPGWHFDKDRTEPPGWDAASTG